MYILAFAFLSLFFAPNWAATPKSIEVPTKFCADRACRESLFNTSFTRDYSSKHEEFLSAEDGAEVQIVGVKYTRRTDALLGKIDDRYGLVYKGFVDPLPYVFFLEESLKSNRKFFRVEHRDKDNTNKPNQVVDEVEAQNELLRDYEVHARSADIPLNEKLLDTLKAKAAEAEAAAAHGHSHSHHGHSHDHSDHSHAHEEHDHHPKGAVTSTQAPVEVPPLSTTPAPVETKFVPAEPQIKPPPQPKAETPVPAEVSKPPTSVVSDDRPPVAEPAPTTPTPAVDPITQSTPVELPVEKPPTPVAESATSAPPPEDRGPNPWTIPPLNVDTATLSTPSIDDGLIPAAQVEANVVPPPVEVSQQFEAPTQPPALKSESPAELPNAEKQAEFEANVVPPVKEAEVRPPLVETVITTQQPPIEHPDPTTPEPPVEAPTTFAPPPVEIPPADPVQHKPPVESTRPPIVEVQPPIGRDRSRGNENSSHDADNGRVFRSFMHTLRTQVPFLHGIDDTGVVVCTYFVIAVCTYVIGWLLNDRKSADALDRRALFEAQTRVKELSLEVQQLQQQRQTPQQLAQQQELSRRCAEQDQTIRTLKAQAIDPRVVAQKDEEISRLRHEHEANLSTLKSTNDEEMSRYAKEVDEYKAEVKQRDQEISNLQKQKSELLKKLNAQNSEYEDLEAKYANLNEKQDQLLQMLADQKTQTATTRAGREECAMSDGSGSGGSGGWSEVGTALDIDAELSPVEADGKKRSTGVSSVESPVEKVEVERREAKRPPQKVQPKWSTGELEEVAAARVELRRVEGERDQLKRQLQTAESELESLRERVRDANSLKAKLEQRDNQVAEMLQMIKEKDQKLGESTDLKEEVYRLDAARERSETNARDLEKRLQRAEEAEQKLRNKWFHDERALNSRIRTLEETIDKLRSSQLYDPINASSPSFERNFSGVSAAGPDVPDLWSPFTHTNEDASFEDSDVSRNEPRRRSTRASGAASPGRQQPLLGPSRLLPRNESFNSTHSGNHKRNSLTNGGGNGTMSRLRSLMDVSTEESMGGRYEQQLPRGTQGRRMRSRSAGRHSSAADVAAAYQSGRRSAHQSGHVSPATSLLRNNHSSATLPRVPSASRLHKTQPSNATNPLFGDFSSDGSGGVRSPPPELVDTSGVLSASTGFAGDLRRPVVRNTVPLGVRLHKPRPM